MKVDIAPREVVRILKERNKGLETTEFHKLFYAFDFAEDGTELIGADSPRSVSWTSQDGVTLELEFGEFGKWQ